MYVNKCIKCGREFETKNPKRVICPECLYPDKKMMLNNTDSSSTLATQSSQAQSDGATEQRSNYSTENKPQFYSSYSSGGDDNRPYQRPQRQYNNNQGGYHRDNNRQGGYNRDYRQNNGGYNNNRYNNNQGGGYQRDNRQGGYRNSNYNNNRQGGYNRDNRQGGYQSRRPQNNRFNNNRRPNNRNAAPKQLLVSREQLEQIELLYKLMLPLPNPDAHEVIGEKIGLEPRKVFFGINLVRQKMMLPKLPFPKRKLAISQDQLNAIKMLYEPLLPLPPIGCHKIIAAQLKMDECRVHVGIGLVRAQMGLERWNQEREDAPEEFKQQAKEKKAAAKKAAKAEAPAEKEEKPATAEAEAPTEEAPKKKRGRKPKAETTAEE